MPLPKFRVNAAAAVAAVALMALTGCQDRTSNPAPPPPASSGEYPTSSGGSPTSSDTPVSSESKVDAKK